jgi:GTP-dependent phosphoenolpyruvate carboxykinase
LAEDRAAAQEPAAHLPRELVPQERGREIPVARLRRQHACLEVDDRRCEGRGGATESPVGYVPRQEDLDTEGMQDVANGTMDELLSVKPDEWKKELDGQQSFFATSGDDLPPELNEQRDKVASRFA